VFDEATVSVDRLSAALDVPTGADLVGFGATGLMARTVEPVAVRDRPAAEPTRTVRPMRLPRAAELDSA
jgi:hypothetical protein